MHRKRSATVVAVLGVSCAVLTAWILGVESSPAAGQAAALKPAKATVITVTAGKPSELSFKLSKTSLLPVGSISFKVTNGGKVPHDFKICTSVTKSSAANSCTGKVTKLLKPGQSATLTVKLSKSGKYEFLCTVPGHANAGMKGLVGVGVKVATAIPTTTTPTTTTPATTTPATTTTTPATTTTTPAAATCASPTATTVTVNEFDFGFTLSQTSIPCGTITFNMTNTGGTAHDFVVQGLTLGAGVTATINTGQTTSKTMTLTPGQWPYLCDIANHAALGMSGVLTVTG